jgi:hypothetical protein
MLVDTALIGTLGLYDLFGVAGAAFYVGNYTLLVTRRTSTDGPVYFVVNLAAASLLLLSLSEAFNLGAALVQLYFCTMSVIGILSRLHPLRRLRRLRPAPEPKPIRWTCPGSVARRLEPRRAAIDATTRGGADDAGIALDTH